MGSVVALGSIIGGGLLAVGLLALPSCPENKLNEVSQPTRFQMKKTYLKNSYAELRQEQIENFHKLNPTTLPPVYTKTPDETDDSDNPKAGFHLPRWESHLLIGLSPTAT